MPDLSNLMGGIFGSMILWFVVIGIVVIVITVIAMRWVRNLSGAGQDQQRIVQTGIPAQAQIIGVQQTNMMVNRQPVAIVTLAVQPPGGAPYQAQVKRIISYFQITQFQPGAVVPVVIDRADPAKVVITL